MSVHPKKEKRHDADFYATQPALVVAMMIWALRLGYNGKPESVLEPGCSGEAPFLWAAHRRLPEARLVGVEQADRPEEPNPPHLPPGAEVEFDTDFLWWAGLSRSKFDLIITNPPFSLAEVFVKAAIPLLTDTGWLVNLMRLDWLGTQKRFERLHKDNPPKRVALLVQRPSFTGGSTDSSEYAIGAWQKRDPAFIPQTRLEWLSWR